MKPGDVVLIRFPHADLQRGKLRPALVIAIAPGRHDDVLLALVSSRINQAIPNFDEIINPNDPDYRASGLKVPSVVRLSRLVTVEGTIIDARLGEISSDRLEQIKQHIIDWLLS
ncbi:MAG: type II toxin-antitoxin system PemK/MazF family toxin [Brevefilum sp.]|nr:type II toxin-antitoxin system PemK/MazF family toxin [Brevefilum sp.]